MRSALLIVAALALGCESKKAAPPPENKRATPAATAPEASLGDLSTSLAAARTAFNAHKGEARFLTLLSPT